MQKRNAKTRGALVGLLALCLATMQIPVSAFAADNQDQRVDVVATDNTGDKNIEVGDITVKNDDGAHVYAFEGASATLTTGNITGGENEWSGVKASADNASSSATVTVNGEVKAGSDAIEAGASDGGTTNVTANGNVTASTGVSASADEATTNAVVNGNVDAASRGVDAGASNGGKVEVTVNGDVSSREIGIRTGSENAKSSVDVTVNGNVTATTDYAIREKTDRGGASSVTVKGDVKGALGAYAGTFGDSDYLFIGDVDDFDNTYEIGGATGGTITLVIDGNLTGTSQAGLEVGMNGTAGTVDVLVTGTIAGNSSDNCSGVVFENDKAAENTMLTAWRITPDKNGAVATTYQNNYNGGAYAAGAIEATMFEAAINYIVKVLQPEVGAILTATNAQGGALAKSHEYAVAHEGEKVLLKVDLQPGYTLVGAYGNEGQTMPLSKDAEGNWYLEVPKGGGVMLSAVVKPVTSEDPTPANPATPATGPESDEPAAPATDSAVATPAAAKTAAASEPASNDAAVADKAAPAASEALPATADDAPANALMLVVYASLAALVGIAAYRRKGSTYRGRHAVR